jgi:glycosyltransferase involved in cell wall biosynthesis
MWMNEDGMIDFACETAMESTPALPEQGQCDLSVIVPVYNETDNLDHLHPRITECLDGQDLSYEIIYVDDGSSDGSSEKLRRICDEDSRSVVIQFRRNFGQTAAMTAGMDHSRGRVIAFMDADMQNDPADIPLLLEKLEEGYDLVVGWRKDRQDDWLWRKVPSFVANRVISFTMGLHLQDYGCTLKAGRRETLCCIRLYGQMHRFIPAFVKLVGGRVTEIPVRHHPRTRGTSKYGIGRTFRVILDLITVRFLSSFSGNPIYLFGGSGLFLMGLSVLCGCAMVVHKIAHNISFVQSPLLMLSTLLFVLGFQSILLGLTAEMLARTYHESQGKPTYVVRRIFRSRPD